MTTGWDSSTDTMAVTWNQVTGYIWLILATTMALPSMILAVGDLERHQLENRP